jgi:hypothetical protein
MNSEMCALVAILSAATEISGKFGGRQKCSQVVCPSLMHSGTLMNVCMPSETNMIIIFQL